MTLSQITPQVNPPSLIPDYVEIPLTRGKVALVSIEDAPRVMEHKWMASRIKGAWYATRGKKQPNGRQSIDYLHRYILQPEPGQQVDHADGNTLDNRRWSSERGTGIRIATRSQNMANRGLQSNNTSGYIGVFANKYGTFEAWVQHLGHQYYLGTHADAVTAAKARDKKAMELWPGFCVLNFPLEAQPMQLAA